MDKLTRLFEIFPNCQMHISFRGNTFYVAIGTKKLIPFQWNKSFTNKQTIEEYSDTYLKLIDVANILIHLHERKKHLLPDGEFLSGEYQDLTF
ncbi:MAG: DUF3137 domain-containing protein [Tannerellaceae bacterium]|nr:DUF3137 domain-containing protein [Tannerellaceae bacterium]